MHNYMQQWRTSGQDTKWELSVPGRLMGRGGRGHTPPAEKFWVGGDPPSAIKVMGGVGPPALIFMNPTMGRFHLGCSARITPLARAKNPSFLMVGDTPYPPPTFFPEGGINSIKHKCVGKMKVMTDRN